MDIQLVSNSFLGNLLNPNFVCSYLNHSYATSNNQFGFFEYNLNNHNFEDNQYFYHTDLPIAIGIGSSSWITDASGSANQHLQYLPYGEDYIYQRTSSWSATYRFTGKERDSETGFDYFGARYYESDISVWLSVDPLADKYPNESAYAMQVGILLCLLILTDVLKILLEVSNICKRRHMQKKLMAN